MKTTIDTNPTHGLALVQSVDPAGNTHSTRYVPLADAPPLDESEERPIYRRQVYLKQHHYVASHALQGMYVADRMTPSGEKPPKDGWTRWKPLK